MKKSFLLFSALMTFSLVGLSQNNANTSVKKSTETIYTSLKPSDASPATFSSKELLDAKVPDKKQAILDQIKQNRSNPAMVKKLREDLWRFENAIVVPTK